MPGQDSFDLQYLQIYVICFSQ